MVAHRLPDAVGDMMEPGNSRGDPNVTEGYQQKSRLPYWVCVQIDTP